MSQEIQQKAAIKATKLEHKSAGSKRAVSANLELYRFSSQLPQIGYLMQSGNYLEDFDTVWAKITKVGGRAVQ